jgi:hypothetical protein
MILTVGSALKSNLMQVEGRYVCGAGFESENGGALETGSLRGDAFGASYNARECQRLLEEPAFALWAKEAGTEYGVTPGDALELLAYALFLDGEM